MFRLRQVLCPYCQKYSFLSCPSFITVIYLIYFKGLVNLDMVEESSSLQMSANHSDNTNSASHLVNKIFGKMKGSISEERMMRPFFNNVASLEVP
jgi:hypothetical protein